MNFRRSLFNILWWTVLPIILPDTLAVAEPDPSRKVKRLGPIPVRPLFDKRKIITPSFLPPVDTSVLQNDIDESFEDEKKSALRSGINGNQYRWPSDINFQISTAFSKADHDRIYSALRTLSGVLTNCRVIGMWPQTAKPTGDYVFITNEKRGCFSLIGRRGRRQTLNLQTPGCTQHGTILHEMIHSVGFHHEHIRPDRDAYVGINWENIQPGNDYNFRTDPQYSSTYNLPYDHYSIMHYGETAFSKNGDKTIKAKAPGIVVGSRGIVTDLDRRKLRAMYNCV